MRDVPSVYGIVKKQSYNEMHRGHNMPVFSYDGVFCCDVRVLMCLLYTLKMMLVTIQGDHPSPIMIQRSVFC